MTDAPEIFYVYILQSILLLQSFLRRRVRVVEGARLESVYTGNRIASSNLAVSAYKKFLRQQAISTLQHKHTHARFPSIYYNPAVPLLH